METASSTLMEDLGIEELGTEPVVQAVGLLTEVEGIIVGLTETIESILAPVVRVYELLAALGI